uniref:Uncharacterized protein n=1 Tax=Octopus bimaculoides TaxID=37653 RepID=A0A0L8HA22_OCTBM
MYTILSPSEIRYTQDSISSCFQNGNDIEDLILDIINGQTRSDEIRTIRVFFNDGKYYSEDNRRLYVFKAVQELSEPNLTIKVKLTSYSDFQENKFTTRNGGFRIRVRRKMNDTKERRNVKHHLSEYFPSLTSGGPTKTTYTSPRTTTVNAAKTKYKSVRTTVKTVTGHSNILPSSSSLTTDDVFRRNASSATNVPRNAPRKICITPKPSAPYVPPQTHIMSKRSPPKEICCCVIL